MLYTSCCFVFYIICMGTKHVYHCGGYDFLLNDAFDIPAIIMI